MKSFFLLMPITTCLPIQRRVGDSICVIEPAQNDLQSLLKQSSDFHRKCTDYKTDDRRIPTKPVWRPALKQIAITATRNRFAIATKERKRMRTKESADKINQRKPMASEISTSFCAEKPEWLKQLQSKQVYFSW